MTIALLFGINSLKSFYVAKATVPKQLIELEELRDKIEELLNGKFDAANKNKIIEFSIAAKLNVKNILPKLKEMTKSQYAKQIEPNATGFINAYNFFITNSTKDSARDMNRRLFEFLRSTELVVHEDDWRRTQ